jgi:dephospho-CoA kinase
MVEAIKLLEGPLRQLCDSIWVTTCAAQTQIARLIAYRQLSAAEAEQRVAAQSAQALKIAQADVVIDTNGTFAETAAQFEQAWQRVAPTYEEDR